MKRWIRGSVALLLLLGLCLFHVGSTGAAQQSEKLRVLVPLMNDNGFITYEGGEFSGYYIDYLTEIAKYTGWEYEFTAVESYEELERASASGEYDLMTGIVYTEEYENQYFEYPRHAVGAKRYVLAVPKDAGVLPDREYAYLRGLRVGVSDNESGRELENRFRNFCDMYGIGCESDLAAYPQGVNFIHIDPSTWKDRLADGTVDGILASDTFCLSQEMFALTTFGLDQIYFVAPNGRAKVVSLLDTVLEKINGFSPDYNDRLYERYFAGNMEYLTSFDASEQEFLKQEHVWKVAMLKNYAPYSYINDKGEAAGLVTRVLDMITEQTDGKLRFQYSFYDSMEEASEAVKNNSCEVNGISTYSLLEDGGSDVRRSMSFYTDSFMYYKNSRRAVEDEKLPAALPELPARLFESCDMGEDCGVSALPCDCLGQVEDGAYRYTVMLSRVGDYYRSYYGYYDLVTYPVEQGDVMFCFAYSPTTESVGVSVIDQCLAGMKTEELDAYVTGVSLFEHKKETMWDYIKDHLEIFALLLAGFLALVCISLMAVVANVTRKSRKIYDLLYKDDVTGGMSYRKFMEVAEAAVSGQERYMMLYMNISSFKYINDVFGYGQGNSVLREVTDYLDAHVRGGLFARVYADRFVAVVSYKGEDDAKRGLQKSMDDFEKICRKKFPSFNIWLKIGAYVIKEEDTIQRAVNLANYAVDEIQRTSKNDYIFYDEIMHDRVLTQKEIEKDMRGAMENGEFEAFYQPKYNIETMELIGAEALVRWRHPDKGLLPPGMFIPIFEKNHYIIPIDFYIFECVCRFIKQLIDDGIPCFAISSNFSRLHLDDSDFVDRLVEIVHKYQVPAQYLEIEITETVAIEDFDQLITTVKQLKAKGFLVSIDDFGSGYSSVQLLYKLPIDVLKFDKNFVDNEGASDIENELVDSIISVSRKNGIQIICEGVETREQEEFVREHNCIYVQGFLYARPMPESDFRKLLEDGKDQGTV